MMLNDVIYAYQSSLLAYYCIKSGESRSTLSLKMHTIHWQVMDSQSENIWLKIYVHHRMKLMEELYFTVFTCLRLYHKWRLLLDLRTQMCLSFYLNTLPWAEKIKCVFYIVRNCWILFEKLLLWMVATKMMMRMMIRWHACLSVDRQLYWCYIWWPQWWWWLSNGTYSTWSGFELELYMFYMIYTGVTYWYLMCYLWSFLLNSRTCK